MSCSPACIFVEGVKLKCSVDGLAVLSRNSFKEGGFHKGWSLVLKSKAVELRPAFFGGLLEVYSMFIAHPVAKLKLGQKRL